MLKINRSGLTAREVTALAACLAVVARAFSANGCRRTVLALSLTACTISCNQTQPSPGEASATNTLLRVTINNLEPRRDVAGQIIDAHDGCLQFFHGHFYLYGTAYGNSDRFSLTNRYRVYSSPDLARWTFEGELLKERPSGIYYRPYVVFNPNTQKYVLWYNWYPKLWNGQVGVAVSDTPVGPFRIVNTNVNVFRAEARPGDGSLFADDDGNGYFIFTAIAEGYAVRVARLTRDYLGTTGETSSVLAKGGEAPLLFRRDNFYYALCGPLCAACPGGSEAQVFKSVSPLGPFTTTPTNNINRRPDGTPNIPAQESWVARIPTSEGPAFIWMADRWESSPDGTAGHDFQFWEPLGFTPEGDILPLKGLARWYVSWPQ